MADRRLVGLARALRSPWWWLASTALSVAAVVALAVTDTAVANGPGEMRSLRYGAPLEWVVQDSTLDPPAFPAHVALSDPHDQVTRVLAVPLLADTAVVLALVVGAWLLLGVAMRRQDGVRTAPADR